MKQYLILILLLVHLSQQASVQTLIDQTEQYTRDGATRAKALFDARCANEINDCPTKIYDQCSNFVPQNMEHTRLDIQANSCDEQGIMLNYNVSAGRCSTSEDCKDENSKRIICSTAKLFDDAANTDGKTLQTKSDGNIIYSYAGYQNSYWNSYPYYHEAFDCKGECKDYDPRYRPWYVGAITGGKNLILVMDYSGSMAGDKIEKAKEAAKSVVDTLGQSDWFQVVFFGTDAQTSDGKTHLMPANLENKQKVMDLIDKQELIGSTNFEAAFTLAFDVFTGTTAQEFLNSSCQNIILFMTDGQITRGESSASGITSLVGTKNTSFNASIFTYSFGDEADTEIVKQIACGNNGIWTQVQQDDIRKVMSSYYEFLAVGLEITEVLWSEIYPDSSLGIDMITATLPFYYEDNGVKRFLGVFGADLLVSELKKYEDFESTVYPQLQSRTRQQCAQNSNTNCQLEKYRSAEQRCLTNAECNVVEDTGFSKCAFSISEDWVSVEGDENGAKVSICKGGDRYCNSASQIQFFIYALIFIFVNIVLI